MNSKFVKGVLLMAGVIFAALQSGTVVWASTILTAIIVGAGYYAKNYLAPSDSSQGSLNWKDVLSGLVLALLSGVGDSLTSLVVNGTIVWALLGKTVLTVALTYFTTTFFSGQLSSPPAVAAK